jgi:CheY-like chemotaxis protein/HAMP domain-containing protein
VLGYVQIQASLQALQRQIVNFTLVLMTVLLVAVFVGYGLISVLQRIITEPLEVFRNTVEEVRLHKKFNSRVNIHSKDELGALASGFNEMLSEIKRRDERLDQYRTSLEKNVQERTVDIQNAYKALENALKNVTDSKSKVEKVSEEKSQIIAEIGKEIRTPMNTIMGMTSLLLDGELNQEQKQYARSTQASAESLMQLVNKLIRNALGDEGEAGDERQQAPVVSASEATLVSSGGDKQLEPIAMHVLVVEDNHLNRQVIELFVKKAGCTLRSVEHGQQAVELAATHKFDLIFMDCYMPVMDGFEATRRIRGQGQLNARAPIVALTANVQRGDREKAFSCGMSDYLEKPIKFEQVYQLLKKYKGGASPAATVPTDNKPAVVVREAAPVLDKSELADLKMATGAQFQAELAKLITTFENVTVESLADIRKAAAQCDWKALYAVSHSLAGATGSVGGKRMAALCRQLMAAAGKEDAQITAFCVEQLDMEYEALHAALRLQQLNSAAG